MSDKVLKVVPAPESKAAPDATSEAPAKTGRSGMPGRKRLRAILLVGLPALAVVLGLGVYLTGGRYI